MLYTVLDTTMTALGDALRSKMGLVSVSGEDKSNLFHLEIKNTADLNIYDLEIDDNGYRYYMIPLPKYNSWYSFIYSHHNSNPYNIPIYLRFYNSDGSIKFEDDIITIYNYTFKNRDIANTYYTNSNYYYGYDPYLVFYIPSVDLEINFILDMYVYDNDLKVYYDLPTFTPAEMVDKINNFVGYPEDKFLITGNASSKFGGTAYNEGSWAWMINYYGDKWHTKDLTSIDNMFLSAYVEKIPFSINCSSGSTVSCSYVFRNSSIKEIPTLNIPKIGVKSSMFSGCRYLREIREDLWNIEEDNSRSSSNTHIFYDCVSLRKLPNKIIANLYDNNTSLYSSVYYCLFLNCYTMDDIIGLGVSTNRVTGNCFRDTFSYCGRLKNITFATNEDGTAQTANWSNQTIDLSYYIGYINSSSYILNYNSGITVDKQVKDDATYQALKNDPDWFSADINYSRYNHDSAVNTINSLPDTSAHGTNTIKFKGAAGAKTDGGAINTLTEEEIAVATVKGWTVSLV